MISEYDLQEAIAECKGVRNPNASTCIKLASYLTIQKELYGVSSEPEQHGYSYASAPDSPIISYTGDTEFSNAVYGMDQQSFMEVMEELMEMLRVLYPKIYNSVMRRF